ncbi:MAG: helix-turn-helix transcriptional regulator [Saprospiraceae bacterium]|nr:helix-turn-helix transcriptional regulator [Saprospiraceae bacterium]
MTNLTGTQRMKKATYTIAKYVADIPNGRLSAEKEALASQLGISIAQLNRIIRGDSDPSGTQLLIIANFFGVSVGELYFTDDNASYIQERA